MEDNLRFQKEFFSNLQLNLITSAYIDCPVTWRDIDYIPDYNKFYLISEGEGWLKIGDMEFYPKPGQLFLMPAGVLQSYSTISSNTFKKYWCHFTAKIGDVNMFDIIDTPYFIDNIDYEKVKNLFEEVIKEQENHKLHARLREKSLLMEIASLFLETANVSRLKLSGFSSMDRLNSVLTYVQEHISENITIEELADKLHYHPNYFTRVFKKYIGMTPIQYITKARMERSKYLLKATTLHVSEIAAEAGFCDIFHFSKTFKSYTGLSPTDFRVI